MEGAGLQSCREVALALLARREHSVKELRTKLYSRGFDDETITAVLADLVDERLLCDERFAREYVRHRAGKGIGPIRLRQELAERGIGNALVAPCLDEYDWFELADEARKKRFGPPVPEDFKARAKQMRFLQYRGFSAEQIRNIFKYNDWEQVD